MGTTAATPGAPSPSSRRSTRGRWAIRWRPWSPGGASAWIIVREQPAARRSVQRGAAPCAQAEFGGSSPSALQRTVDWATYWTSPGVAVLDVGSRRRRSGSAGELGSGDGQARASRSEAGTLVWERVEAVLTSGSRPGGRRSRRSTWHGRSATALDHARDPARSSRSVVADRGSRQGDRHSGWLMAAWTSASARWSGGHVARGLHRLDEGPLGDILAWASGVAACGTLVPWETKARERESR